MPFTVVSYALAMIVVAGWFAFPIVEKASATIWAVTWLPLYILVAAVPLSWICYRLRARKDEKKKAAFWWQIVLVPVWVYAVCFTAMIVWFSTVVRA